MSSDTDPLYVKSGLTWVSEARGHQVRGRHSIPNDVTDHESGDLTTAAACLAQYAAAKLAGEHADVEAYDDDGHPFWPWSDASWTELTSGDVRGVLAHAAALLAAEIDREQKVAQIL